MSGNISFQRIINVSNEYKYLNEIKDQLLGMYVLPREDDIFTWDGIIFVSSGNWEEGIFKFSLKIPVENYETTIPILKFITPLYHPFVNPRTNCLDIQYIFPQWRSDPHSISTILLKVSKMFYLTSFDINLCPNVEAAKFFDANTTEIKKKETLRSIKRCVEDSIKDRFDPIPGASLVFVKPSNSDIDEYNNIVKEFGL